MPASGNACFPQTSAQAWCCEGAVLEPCAARGGSALPGRVSRENESRRALTD